MVREQKQADGGVVHVVEARLPFRPHERVFGSMVAARDFLGSPPEHRYVSQWLHFVRLAYETTARTTELSAARWIDFDLEARRWSIPREHNKYGRARTIPLTAVAIESLDILRGMSELGDPKVFQLPRTRLGKDVVLFSRSSRCLGIDAADFFELRKLAVSRMIARCSGLALPDIARIIDRRVV